MAVVLLDSSVIFDHVFLEYVRGGMAAPNFSSSFWRKGACLGAAQ
jgi:hypothetical protein